MNQNTEFELFAQRIYQKLVNNDVLKPTIVEHDVKLKGKSGCEHQIDVYWRYAIADVNHSVAIECKNYNSLVPIGKVRDFFGVLHDLNGVNGIMVSRKGFQDGAKKYAEHYGISLKTLREPTEEELIGSIVTVFHTDMRHRLFLIDEEWANANGFNIQSYRERIASTSINKSDYWRYSLHLPLNLKDNVVFDSQGSIVTSIKQIEDELPGHADSGVHIDFPFEDGMVVLRNGDKLKIKAIRYEYESEDKKTELGLLARDFVDGILEDALNEKIDYVSRL